MRLRPVGRIRADRDEPRRLRAIPARIGLDLGAHGADPRASGGRRRRGCAAGSSRRSRRRWPCRATPLGSSPMSPRCASASPTSTPHPAAWDLRNRRGGLVDLEFIVQYLMLREAAATPHGAAPRHRRGDRGARRCRCLAAAGGAGAGRRTRAAAQCARALDAAVRRRARARSARGALRRDIGALRRRD